MGKLSQPDIKKKIEEVKADIDIENMPLEKLSDYIKYNKYARLKNMKLKEEDRYPIKPCPAELHPQETVIISSNTNKDQKIHAFLSNDMIHFDEKLEQHQKYTLPRCVVEHLSKLGTDLYKEYKFPEGTSERRVIGKEPRFSIRNIYGD